MDPCDAWREEESHLKALAEGQPGVSLQTLETVLDAFRRFETEEGVTFAKLVPVIHDGGLWFAAHVEGDDRKAGLGCKLDL
jgi:hypothetical protein